MSSNFLNDENKGDIIITSLKAARQKLMSGFRMKLSG